MSTSGTIAQTPVSVETMLSYAFSRCGKLSSTVSGDLLSKARLALYFILADLSNDGINLWCMNKSVVNVVPQQASYQLPVGTNDVTNMLYRQLHDYVQLPTLTPDAYAVQLEEPQAINNITGAFTQAGTASLAVEWSPDGLGWELLQQLEPFVTDDASDFVIDLDATKLAAYWRVRDTSGTLMTVSTMSFRTVKQEVTMSLLNRDDYTNLPNKHNSGQQSLQFWFDKQIDPRVWVWPISNRPQDQLVIWSALQIQDPGSLTNDLAVPTRWYKAITDKLAAEVALLIPPAELPPGRLEALLAVSAASYPRAAASETDGSSFQLQPRISVYTR